MSFVTFDKKGRLLDAAGNPVHIVGINYVASYICTNFWEDWRPDVIEKDLKKIAELGLNAVRIPMHWGFMEPEPGRYNPVFEQEFADFMGMCRKYGLYVMPWFLVGVATRDYDVPFRNGRSFFDDEMTRIAAEHLKHFIAPYKDEEWILFWDICDEPEWYSRNPGADQLPYDRMRVVRWVKEMYDAIRSVDSNHLITLGFGHIATANYGMDVRDMAEVLDLMVVTAYPQASRERLDTVRNNYTVPYHVKMNSRGTPVFACEAPGMSSIVYSEEIIGRYFKTTLYSNLVNGSTGVLPWVFNDFEESLWHDVPLEKYLIEPSFGIITVDGRLKPSGQELRDFAAFAKKAELGKYRPQKAEVAVMIPEGYYQKINVCYDKIYTAFELAKGCGVDVDFVWTSEDFSGYKLLLMPTTVGMTTSAWDKVRRFVEDGGMLYHIYDGCSPNGYFNRLFGVEVQADEFDNGHRQMVAQQAWGSWNPGDAVPFVGTNRGSVLDVSCKDAQTLFSLEDGKPALLRHNYGKGTCFLATIPLDNGLMKIPYREFLETSSFELLNTMMEEAGICRIIRINHPAVETGCMVDSETGEMLVICINHDNAEVEAEIKGDTSQIPTNWQVRNFDTGEIVDLCGTKVRLEPAGVMIYKIASEKI